MILTNTEGGGQMRIQASSVDEYITKVPMDRKEAMEKLRKTIMMNLPSGFEETMAFGAISYVVPKSIYPQGYHADPKEPLPFISIASQKDFIGLYHMGIYALPNLLAWFQEAYINLGIGKLDMGKACIRLKKMNAIPYDLIGELCGKITPEQYLSHYMNAINR
jgi:hypothetical protein